MARGPNFGSGFGPTQPYKNLGISESNIYKYYIYFLYHVAGGLFQRAQQSDLQRAMDVYQQEFNRLHQNALAAAFRAQQNGGSKDEDTKSETPHPPESPAPSSGDTKSPGARQESPIGNCLIY